MKKTNPKLSFNLNIYAVLVLLFLTYTSVAEGILNPYALESSLVDKIAQQKTRLATATEPLDKATINYNIGLLLETEGKIGAAYLYYSAALENLDAKKCSDLAALLKSSLAYIASISSLTL